MSKVIIGDTTVQVGSDSPIKTVEVGGPIGPQGPVGSVWRDGSGAPANSLGLDNDFYLDNDTGDVYEKQSGTYSQVANIRGIEGTVWRDGSGAPANSLGVNGDYYLDNSTGDVYNKSVGTYSIVANIEGPGDMDTSVYDVDVNGIVDQAEELHDGVDTVTTAQARSHIDSVANPHNVTPAQIAAVLADLTNVVITTPADNELLAYNTGTGEWINQTPAEAGVATAADLTAHEGDQANPHAVTKAQVGLGNVTNDQQVPKAGGTFTGAVRINYGYPALTLYRPDAPIDGRLLQIFLGSGGELLFSPRNDDETATGSVVRLFRDGEITTGGNPVVDSDSNANGSWVRYYDGTQICWYVEALSAVAMTTAAAGGFRSAIISKTLPANFTGVQQAWGSTYDLENALMMQTAVSLTSWTNIVLWRADSAQTDANISLVAIGRWY